MLNDTANVMTELAPKGPRFVEIIEIMDRLDIPFIQFFGGNLQFFYENSKKWSLMIGFYALFEIGQ